MIALRGERGIVKYTKQERKELAERAGFEPAGAFQRRALSKRVP